MYLLNGTQFLFGPGKEEQQGGCEGTSGFFASQGSYSNIDFGKHMVLFMAEDT